MLKALELIGFKSFADKTRFEFPPGITVIVGPNGSGKSNIVDAMKWVLGEQSAKSLRGKDMADVIFKGSGDGGRKMVNSAEATIIFDNSAGQLAIEAPEVHITRRVYRSGEGEYLINRQPCRLKDIRHLFRGTGVGVDAYSLIEQGKVDRMLQASPRDRRAIFEEAAGISRFKAKKLEAQRRLERVEQNLLRLSDIVEEVESRLRSVRSQATKARRYREYRDRLQELRTYVGRADWRRLTGELTAAEGTLSQLHAQTAQFAAQADTLATQLADRDAQLVATMEALRNCENQAAHHREQIAGLQSTLEQSRLRSAELEDNAARHRRQRASMSGRAGDLHERLAEVRERLAQASSTRDRLSACVKERDQLVERLSSQLEELRSRGEAYRRNHLDQLRSAATLASRASSLQSQYESGQTALARARQTLAELEATRSACLAELQHARQQATQGDAHGAQLAALLGDAREQAQVARQQQTRRREMMSELQQRCSAARERVAVLDDLDKNYEGLALGVREVLELAREASSGAFADVHGLVADLIQVDVDIAPLVDVVLGDKAQHIVLARDELLELIRSGAYSPAGRVGFVALPICPSPPRASGLGTRTGVIGRLAELVSAADHVRPLVEQLLGDAWCVESLAVALDTRQTCPDAGRLVTLAGELVDRDGTVVVGARSTIAGLVARRSELRKLQQEVLKLDEQAGELHAELLAVTEQRQRLDNEVARLEHEHHEAERALADQQAQCRLLQQRSEELDARHQTAVAELSAAESESARVQQELSAAQPAWEEAEQHATRSERLLQELEATAADIETQRDQSAQQCTGFKIELAASEQNVQSLDAALRQLQNDQEERSRALSDSSSQLAECLARRQDNERELLRHTSAIASLSLSQETLDRTARQLLAQHRELTAGRAQLLEQNQSLQTRQRQLEETQHQRELEVGEIRHQCSTLIDRLREDYDLDVAQLEQPSDVPESSERAEIDQEIAELRRKLNNIGAVNEESLAELDALESRFGKLSQQYHDLRQAKESLERIIARINADSRRLFEETLEAIRVNFQTLYRKAFGGGRADLVLEEGVDVLEAGVDIIATPPGKPSFNNSLLSGGEKALTAVSLLLAIFQYRPSPFCVLDEVDAPFDEANIGRFVDVLKGFLDWTKFVIVTHSKKTMTAATTLYGVTMQESGVSKRVSVRFEDVSEDGHIRHEAADREIEQAPEHERGAA
jgi:chromosome segregation protein